MATKSLNDQVKNVTFGTNRTVPISLKERALLHKRNESKSSKA